MWWIWGSRLRQLVVLITLVIILVVAYQLSRLAQDWHYVVPAEPGELLFVSSFDNAEDDSWVLYESNTQNSSQIVDGVMRLEMGVDQNVFWSETKPFFGDFDLTVDARVLDSPVETVYGVLFRQRDESNFYAFNISTDGFYRVIRYTDNRTRVISNWHTSPIINQGIGAVNQLRVIGVGDQFAFFINGERVELCIPDDPSAESTPQADGRCLGGRWLATLDDDTHTFGHLAVMVEAEAEAGMQVEFDNLVVYGPEPIENQ